MKPALSVRERQVGELVIQKKADKVIAHELGLSIYTVRNHIQNAAEKIGGDGPRKWRLAFFILEQPEGE